MQSGDTVPTKSQAVVPSRAFGTWHLKHSHATCLISLFFHLFTVQDDRRFYLVLRAQPVGMGVKLVAFGMQAIFQYKMKLRSHSCDGTCLLCHLCWKTQLSS